MKVLAESCMALLMVSSLRLFIEATGSANFCQELLRRQYIRRGAVRQPLSLAISSSNVRRGVIGIDGIFI
jgi:hypothetical protein